MSVLFNITSVGWILDSYHCHVRWGTKGSAMPLREGFRLLLYYSTLLPCGWLLGNKKEATNGRRDTNWRWKRPWYSKKAIPSPFPWHSHGIDPLAVSSPHPLLKSIPEVMFSLILERKEGREGEIRMWERNICLLYMPQMGLKPQPRYAPWWGTELVTFWCMGLFSNQLTHNCQGRLHFWPLLSLVSYTTLGMKG